MKRLKELRKARDMTLLEVAKALGVSESTVQRYESGEIKNLKHETVAKLSELFRVSPSYLMEWETSEGEIVKVEIERHELPAERKVTAPNSSEIDIRTERLVRAFRDSGLTQTEVCKRTGITNGTLSSYLSGRYRPKQKALESLSIVLKVPITYLMGIDNEPEEHSAAELVHIFKSLNEAGQNFLMTQAKVLRSTDEYSKKKRKKED